MRSINLAVLHHSASDDPDHDNLATIRSWHHARGFTMEGYHYFIRKSGVLELGRPLNMIGAHCKGFNEHSIGICLSGNKLFSKAQIHTAARLLLDLKLIFKSLTIVGHKQLVATECPSYSVQEIKGLMHEMETTGSFSLERRH